MIDLYHIFIMNNILCESKPKKKGIQNSELKRLTTLLNTYSVQQSCGLDIFLQRENKGLVWQKLTKNVMCRPDCSSKWPFWCSVRRQYFFVLKSSHLEWNNEKPPQWPSKRGWRRGVVFSESRRTVMYSCSCRVTNLQHEYWTPDRGSFKQVHDEGFSERFPSWL